MGWKNWPTWLKGGIIGTVLAIAFLLLIFLTGNNLYTFTFILFIYHTLLNCELSLFNPSDSWFCQQSAILYTFIIALGIIILGLLIGLIIGKIKSKNKSIVAQHMPQKV